MHLKLKQSSELLVGKICKQCIYIYIYIQYTSHRILRIYTFFILVIYQPHCYFIYASMLRKLAVYVNQIEE